MKCHDAIIVGSGVGGSLVARRLAEAGARVLLLERGDWVPREPENWSVQKVFCERIYKARDQWIDGHGRSFDPGMYYNVGGMTKFYGGAMFRLREKDFEALEHKDGTSPAWPVSYQEMAPWYSEAERVFRVHGDDAADNSAPMRAERFPFAAVPNAPQVEQMAVALRSQGLSPSSLPLAVFSGAAGSCILCRTCDGFPCRITQKGDAESCGVHPALATGNVNLVTNAHAETLELSPDGKKVTAICVRIAGELKRFAAPLFVVSCNAVNSAALLLRSAGGEAPKGVANSSGVVGRHYMAHNQTALMSVSARRNDTVFQKTLALNDFYFGDDAFPWPMGQMQMLGKLQGGMLSANIPFLPRWCNDQLATHSMDWIGLSEDLPDPDNRVTLDGSRIRLSVTPNNMTGHHELVRRMKRAMKRAAYPIVLTKPLISHATGHQCGTVRMGDDPASAALDSYCRSYDHPNLFVVDASFFPSSAAVNPALTIAAQALRVSRHILRTDLCQSN